MADKDLILKIKAQDDSSATLNKVAKTVGEAFAVKKLVDFGKALYSSFSNSQESMLRFNAILDNTTGATQELRDGFIKVAESAVRFGVDDDTALTSLANFYQRTKDATSALDLHNLALNMTAQTGKSYSESVEMINQIMAGRTTPAIKEFNLTLDESANPLKTLESLYAKTFGATAKLADSANTAQKRLSESLDNLRQSMGDMLGKALTPLVNILSSLIDKFLSMPKWIQGTISVIVSLATAFGGLIIAFSLFSSIWPNIVAGFSALKIAIGALSGPVGWVIGAITLLVSGVALLGNKLGWFSSETKSSASSTQQFNKTLESLQGGIINTGTSLEDLTDKIKDVKDQILDLNKNMARDIVDSGQRQIILNQDIGDAIVEQQQKISDIQKEIQDEKNKSFEDRDDARLNNLIQQLGKEQLALQNASDISIQYETNVAEAKRRISLTEFERRIEDIQKEKKAEQQRLIEKVAEYQAELALLKAHYADLTKEMEAFTKKAQEEDDKRAKSAEQSAERIRIAQQQVYSSNLLNSVSKISSMTGQSISGARANGGSVLGGSSYLVGERGPELFTPSSSGVITPNSKLGGGIVINVYGDVSGNDLIEKVKTSLMNMLRLDSKLAI